MTACLTTLTLSPLVPLYSMLAVIWFPGVPAARNSHLEIPFNRLALPPLHPKQHACLFYDEITDYKRVRQGKGKVWGMARTKTTKVWQ